MRLINFFLGFLLIIGCESSNSIDLNIYSKAKIYVSLNDYSGVWESKGKTFENTLELERINGNEYRFSINSWRETYDYLIGDTTRFLGTMNDEDFIIVIQDGYAEFIDSKEKQDVNSLYLEDEEPCKLFFQFRNNIINIKSEFCHLIYGGYGIMFDGEYLKK